MSDPSGEQFQELLTHLVAHMSDALEKAESLPPMAFTLNHENEVASIVGASDDREALRETLKAMQKTLAAQAQQGGIIASCMSYADFGDQCIVALMENNENYCSEIRLPVIRSGQELALDLENLSVNDGSIYVFPITDDT